VLRPAGTVDFGLAEPAAAIASISAMPAAPEVTIPDEPATELIITDLTVGEGQVVGTGDTVEVHYIGVGQESKEKFDSSFDRGESISFGLNQVIAGWSQGLVGMAVGGRRHLVIPGHLAYGDRSPTPAIRPNETLVFVVDLIGIR